MQPNPKIQAGIMMVLEGLGYDLADQHFMETPKRVAKYLMEFKPRPDSELDTILKTFEEPDCDELVMVKDISFTALCAHHMLPFTGRAAVGYIPNGRVLGISKLARVTEFFARRLTLQERITQQIADALQSRLQPKGVMVVLESGHQCMTIRGVKQASALTVTSAVRGVFLDDRKHSKDEFLKLMGR